MGSPDEKPIQLDSVQIPEHIDLSAVSVIQRKKDIRDYRRSHPGTVMSRVETVVPAFDDPNERNAGVYSVIYRSVLDNAVHAIWIKSSSINKAVKEAVAQMWDAKEIIDAKFEGSQSDDLTNDSTFDVGYSEKLRSLDDYKDIRQAGQAVASQLTKGEFNDIKELVADCHDDETTENNANGNIYEGVDVNGNVWSGKKSSYRNVLDEGKFVSGSDYEIDLITKVNLNGSDTKSATKFNSDAFRLALKRGIIHFVYTKKSNNAERQAFGTTNPDILDKAGVVPSTQQQYTRNTSPDIIVYYDMTAHAWRSFIKDNVTVIYDESY